MSLNIVCTFFSLSIIFTFTLGLCMGVKLCLLFSSVRRLELRGPHLQSHVRRGRAWAHRAAISLHRPPALLLRRQAGIFWSCAAWKFSSCPGALNSFRLLQDTYKLC